MERGRAEDSGYGHREGQGQKACGQLGLSVRRNWTSGLSGDSRILPPALTPLLSLLGGKTGPALGSLAPSPRLPSKTPGTPSTPAASPRPVPPRPSVPAPPPPPPLPAPTPAKVPPVPAKAPPVPAAPPPPPPLPGDKTPKTPPAPLPTPPPLPLLPPCGYPGPPPPPPLPLHAACAPRSSSPAPPVSPKSPCYPAPPAKPSAQPLPGVQPLQQKKRPGRGPGKNPAMCGGIYLSEIREIFPVWKMRGPRNRLATPRPSPLRPQGALRTGTAWGPAGDPLETCSRVSALEKSPLERENRVQKCRGPEELLPSSSGPNQGWWVGTWWPKRILPSELTRTGTRSQEGP